MSKAIGIKTRDGVEWHAAGVVNDYDSLCGTDANDPGIEHYGTVPAPRGQKIECLECLAIWWRVMELKLRATDFSHNIRQDAGFD